MPIPASWPRRDADHLLVTSAVMATLEQELFNSGLPVAALMEKAALALSRRLLESLVGNPTSPDRGADILVLVGPGLRRAGRKNPPTAN